MTAHGCMTRAEIEAMIPALHDLGLYLCDCEYFVRAALLPPPAPRPVVAQGNLHHCPTAAGPSSPLPDGSADSRGLAPFEICRGMK